MPKGSSRKSLSPAAAYHTTVPFKTGESSCSSGLAQCKAVIEWDENQAEVKVRERRRQQNSGTVAKAGKGT